MHAILTSLRVTTVLVMFSMVKMLTAGVFRTDAISCVLATLIKWPMIQAISEDSPIWEQFGGEKWHALLIIFVLETVAVLSWAHVPLSSGGDRWQMSHANKFAILLGVFVLVHNPTASASRPRTRLHSRGSPTHLSEG